MYGNLIRDNAYQVNITESCYSKKKAVRIISSADDGAHSIPLFFENYLLKTQEFSLYNIAVY